MNALEVICKMGVKNENVPDSFSKISSQDIMLEEKIEKLKHSHMESLSSLLSSLTYDDIMEVDEWNDEVLNEQTIEELFDFDEESENEDRDIENMKEIQDFIECLKYLISWNISNIDVDFKKNLIMIE